MATSPRKYVQKSALINQFLVYLLYSLSKMMIAMTRMYANIEHTYVYIMWKYSWGMYAFLTMKEALRNHTPYTHSLSYDGKN